MLRSHSVNSFDTDEDMANVEDNMYETLVSNGGGVGRCEAAWGSVGRREAAWGSVGWREAAWGSVGRRGAV